MALATIVFVVALIALSYFLPSTIAAWIAGGISLLVLVARWLLGRIGMEHVQSARELVRASPAIGRVRCNGKARKLARIIALGAIEDRMFEPQVFLSIGAAPSPRRKQVVQIVAGILIAGAAAWAEWHFMRRLTAPYFIFLAGVAGAMLVGTVVYPTYLRVVPGRIDIMECALLGRRIIRVRRIDLRSRAVTIDAGAQLLHVDAVPKFELIPFAAIWDRWAFAHAALMAAVSSHTPPPLPDDALVG